MPVKAHRMGRVLEPSTGLVHYAAAPEQDAVTLCGLTDWSRESGKVGASTNEFPTCHTCKGIVVYVQHGGTL